MRFRELSVGKPRDAAVRELHSGYADRITRLQVAYESAWIAEVRAGGRFSDDHVREREARGLLERIGRGGGRIVALDAGGAMWTSTELAARAERWSTPRCHLVIGGPLGLHRSLLDRADTVWSISRLTFPHEIVRVLVAEQIYRAVTLLRGVPYHK